MRNPIPISVLVGALAVGPTLASYPSYPSTPSASRQGSDPLTAATGWARVDKDGSCIFYSPTTRSLDTWTKDQGVTASLDVSKLEVPPEKWVVDPYGNAWIVSGSTLYQITKNGKTGSTVKLPGEVVDLAWDTKGFVLLYRTSELFLEKHDYTKANVIWSVGKKPKAAEAGASLTRRLAISEEGSVLVATGSSVTLQTFEGVKGTVLGDVVFTFNNSATPGLLLGGRERGALSWWMGKGVVLAAVPASQVPSEKKSGLLLARLDLSGSTLEFLPTGVTEDHKLLGALDSEVVLLKPGGGLIFVPVR